MKDSNTSPNKEQMRTELLFQKQLKLIINPLSGLVPLLTNGLPLTDETWNVVILTQLVLILHALIGFNETIFASIYQHLYVI